MADITGPASVIRIVRHHQHMEITCDNRSRKIRTALAMLFLPTCCFANGEQVLVLPFCNAIALVAFIVFVFIWRSGATMTFCAFGLFVLGVVLSWALPLMPHTVAAVAGCSFIHIFLVGFGVPAVTVTAGCLIIRAMSHRKKDDA